MASFQINDDEWEALMGVSHFVFRLYVVLRRSMDYRTGMVGMARRVSYRTLAQSLAVDAHQGEVDSGDPHTSRMKRAVERMVGRGLLERVDVGSDHRKLLIFRLPLADADDSVQKKPGPNPDQTRTTHAGPAKPRSGAGLREKPGPNPDDLKTENPDPLPVSGIRIREEPTPHTVPNGEAARALNAAGVHGLLVELGIAASIHAAAVRTVCASIAALGPTEGLLREIAMRQGVSSPWHVLTALKGGSGKGTRKSFDDYRRERERRSGGGGATLEGDFDVVE